MKIAKNFSDGLGLTFDGVSKTNGFHPLYMTVISLWFCALKPLGISNPETLYRFVCVLHVLIVHLIALVVYYFFEEDEKRKTKFAFFVLFGLIFVFIRDFGLESHLSCLVLILYLYNRIKKEQVTKIIVINSVLISLLFLSRTDYILSLIPFLILSDYLTSEPGKKKTVFVYNVSIPLLAAVLYFSVNLLIFGNFQSVSSMVVNSFPQILLTVNIKELLTNPGFLLNQTTRLLIFISATIIVFFIAKKNQDKDFKTLFFVSAGFLLNIITHLLFNRYNIREWYLTLPLFASVFTVAALYNVSSRKINSVVMCFAGLAIIALMVSTRTGVSKWASSLDYSKILSENTEKNDLIYQFDYSGVVSFFSERKIINGDGFVNSAEYYEVLRNNKIPEFLNTKGIKYISSIIHGGIKYDSEDNFIFKNEPFLNRLNIKANSIVLIYDFSFKHALTNKKGVWVLIDITK